MPTIDILPDKSTYRPGDPAGVAVTVANDTAAPLRGQLVLELATIHGVLCRSAQPVALAPGAGSTLRFTLHPPALPRRGYGLDATLYAGDATGEDGQVLARASGALDVLERWSQAPRYGFLSDFAPQAAGQEARYDSLLRYHVNVVQFYDWMWRHYQLLPPAEEFTDAMGRNLSLPSVRDAIAGVQQRGAAALAYGAVYGAEPEFALVHPELLLYDEEKQPISLAELFYIMNIAPGSPWVPLIVAEFAEAVRALDFDGIHLDQYGFPKTAWAASSEPVNLADAFPPLIDQARAAVVAAKPEAGVIFNAVGNWPVETVAPTTQDAVYIEVWPPDEDYADLVRLIRDARCLSAGKQVILAAYLAPFAAAGPETLPGAEAAALLATAAIAAAGGFHLLLGECAGILCDPYYPKYATMRPAFARQMRTYYDFLVRYEEFLTAPELQDRPSAPSGGADGSPLQMTVTGVRVSRQPEAGALWTLARRKPGYHLVHLINLADQTGTHWNALRTPAAGLGDLELAVSDLPAVRRVLLISPDANQGRPLAVPWTQAGGMLTVRVPRLVVWTVVVMMLASPP
jgi:dextranase